MARVKVGFECKFYRQTAGTRAAWPESAAAPSLDEVTNIKDVTTTLEKDEIDVTTRATDGWEVIRAGLKKAPIEFKMNWKPGDADFEAFKDAFFNDTTIACAVLDGGSTTPGSQGLWADFEVLKFSRTEPLRGAVEVDVMLKPADSDVAPEWAVVGS